MQCHSNAFDQSQLIWIGINTKQTYIFDFKLSALLLREVNSHCRNLGDTREFTGFAGEHIVKLLFFIKTDYLGQINIRDSLADRD